MKKQNGFILLQVMLIFAILMVIVAQTQYKQRIQIQRTLNTLFLSQAQAYAESAEAIAQVGLTLDIENSETDHLYELWNTSEGMFPLDDGGLIEIELNDLQGRFNVNWLSPSSGFRDGGLKSFKKLLALIEGDIEVADELFQWFDQDSGVDFYYSDELPSYAPSYHEMVDTSELLLLKSVDQSQLKIISPYLTALPSDSKLNINTAPIEIIQSVANFINDDMANQAVTDRGEEGFSAVTDFMNLDVFKENEESGIFIPSTSLSVTSEWFELYTAVTLNEKTLTQRSVVHRNEQGNTTLTLRDRTATSPSRIPNDPVKGLEADPLADDESNELN
jgi:general secretion pathway protein K